MKERIIFFVMLLYLILNLPFPNLTFEKREIKQGRDIEIKYEPVNPSKFQEIEISGDFDSVFVETGSFAKTFTKRTINIPLELGKNTTLLSFFKQEKIDSASIEIYRPYNRKKILVILSQIDPIIKFLRNYSLKNPEYEFSFYIKYRDLWYSIGQENISLAKEPKLDEYNGIIVDENITGEFPIRIPSCILLRKGNNFKISSDYLVSERFRIKAQWMEIIVSPDRSPLDTIIRLDARKIPIFYTGAEQNFFFAISNILELQLKNPELMDTIFDLVLDRISYPKAQIVELNGKNYIVLDPMKLSTNFSMEVLVNDQKMSPLSLIRGYMEIPLVDSINTVKVIGYLGKRTIYELKETLSSSEPEKAIKKFKRKLKLELSPSQSNPTFLVLFFIYTALIFTLSGVRRKKDENG